ncbi:unnamed protein product [Eruca vesicaria subsp. sativa]|uniref:Uncharacterized protein n=1 Tax=Eruca vesicaria subsp. sativa TaxID=29727 RepID=A0ABC8LQU4_ERUVS|nr:unnamed protein product [Eruca vesicaria subsp. sativa]
MDHLYGVYNILSIVVGQKYLNLQRMFDVQQEKKKKKKKKWKHMRNNHHILLLEASAPSVNINRMNRLSESKDGEKNGDARPQQTLLRFKFATLKRPSCLTTKRSVQGHRWFQEGEVNREKKSKIEENHQRIDLANIVSDVK